MIIEPKEWVSLELVAILWGMQIKERREEDGNSVDSLHWHHQQGHPSLQSSLLCLPYPSLIQYLITLQLQHGMIRGREQQIFIAIPDPWVNDIFSSSFIINLSIHHNVHQLQCPPQFAPQTSKSWKLSLESTFNSNQYSSFRCPVERNFRLVATYGSEFSLFYCTTVLQVCSDHVTPDIQCLLSLRLYFPAQAMSCLGKEARCTRVVLLPSHSQTPKLDIKTLMDVDTPDWLLFPHQLPFLLTFPTLFFFYSWTKLQKEKERQYERIRLGVMDAWESRRSEGEKQRLTDYSVPEFWRDGFLAGRSVSRDLWRATSGLLIVPWAKE